MSVLCMSESVGMISCSQTSFHKKIMSSTFALSVAIWALGTDTSLLFTIWFMLILNL